MATAMEFDSLQALFDYVANSLFVSYGERNITSRPYGYDERVNQYLTAVKLDRMIVGFIFEDVNDIDVVNIKE